MAGSGQQHIQQPSQSVSGEEGCILESRSCFMVGRVGGFDELTTQQKVNINVNVQRDVYIYIYNHIYIMYVNIYASYNVCNVIDLDSLCSKVPIL